MDNKEDTHNLASKDKIITRSPAVWTGIIVGSFTCFVGGLFYLLSTITMELSVGLILAYAITITSAVCIFLALFYGFVILRLNDLLITATSISNKVATKKDQDFIKESVEGAAKTITTAYNLATKELLKSANNTGLENVYQTFSEFESRLKELLDGATREVAFLGISNSTLNRIPEFANIIDKKSSEGVTFRIAFMSMCKENGNIDLYDKRAKDENFPIKTEDISDLRPMARNNINSLLAIRDTMKDEHKEKLKIGIYHAFPYMALFIIDNKIFIGTYLFGEKCNISPVYEITKKDKGIYDTYYKHFERIWKACELINEPIDTRYNNRNSEDRLSA